VVGIAAQAAIAMDNARLYQQAQQAIEGRNAFLAAASHDLKNPLAVIKARAQILRRLLTRPNPAPERLAESLDGITTTVARMTALIDTLLDVARLQSGQPLPLDPQETDLVALARQVVAEQGATSEQHQVRVETPLPSLVGRWDAPRLQRVLTNLLDNAIKYSPDGGAIVVRVAHDQQADTPWAVLAVEDSGIGIPAADLSRIFEQFQRGGNVRGELGGTGVGLATVRWIVTEHQGTVAIESQERVGTTVTVRLPLAPDKSRSPDELPAQ
jgi:signal transduction histidine kinase